MGDRKNLKFVIIGHVDHGKSTLIGRLFFDTNSLPYDKIEEVKKASKDRDDSEIEFAFLMDHLREEREQGVTIDTAQTFFKTSKREYVIIDAPGHVEFVKNMITGASQAEAALLIVDVGEGVAEQTKRHANLISMLGLNQIIVVINKMDEIDYKEERFKEVKKDISKFFNDVKLKGDFYIPISALKGENVVTHSKLMPWYKGPTILESLDSLKNRDLPKDKSLIFPIQDVYKISGKRIAVGRVEAGYVEDGMEVKMLPDGVKIKVKSIEKFNENKNRAVAGESIGIITESPVFLQRGNILCIEGMEPITTKSFEANLIWLSKDEFDIRKRIKLRLATQEINGNIKSLKKRIDSSSLEILEENAGILKNLEIGDIVFEAKNPISITKFNDIQELGRFVLVRGNDVVAGGIIT
jgi:sulfate adenylyltransferase large subunit